MSMARNKEGSLKSRLISAITRNRLPPVWVLLKKFGIGKGRRTPLSRLKRKRNWRRKKLKV